MPPERAFLFAEGEQIRELHGRSGARLQLLPHGALILAEQFGAAAGREWAEAEVEDQVDLPGLEGIAHALPEIASPIALLVIGKALAAQFLCSTT